MQYTGVAGIARLACGGEALGRLALKAGSEVVLPEVVLPEVVLAFAGSVGYGAEVRCKLTT
jgi:hypothetical protein